jgi:N utilization substance protein A
MFDLKVLNSALSQLQEEKGIPKEKIIEAIEDALAAAYKKDYGKKGQIIRATFDPSSGKVNFFRVKIVVSSEMLREEDEEVPEETFEEEGDKKIFFNEEHHILIDDAKKIKGDVKVDDEIVFPLEEKDDYGRIAAQTAKQVIIQRLREAERVSVVDEFSGKQGDIVSGTVQRIERGTVFIDLGRVTGILPREEQIMGEYYRQGERIKALLLSVSETPRGIDLRLSRSHPDFLSKLFALESPEVANKVVTIPAIAREAGSRSKVAVLSHDENIDPVGSLVGQRGIRVNTVINELGGEKIDIIEWSEDPEEFITQALSPARVLSVEIDEERKEAKVSVDADQFSLAIGKGGQNVRLAAKLTGWKIDISSPTGESVSESPDGKVAEEEAPAPASENPEKEVPESEGDGAKKDLEV